MRRLALALLVLLAAVLATARPATAVTRPKATAAALAALGASKVAGPVIVFGLPSALPKGAGVSEAGPGPSGKGKATVASDGVGDVETWVDKGKGVAAGTWLFWMDLAPYAHFAHGSVMVLIGANGKVVRKQPLSWWPLVNGKAPAFFAPAGYRSARYRVYSKGVPKLLAHRVSRAPAGTSAMTASKFPNDCIVVAGDQVDANFAGDQKQIAAGAKTLGIPLETATSAADLEKKVTKLAGASPACTDVIVYLDAHGYAATGSNYPSGTPGSIIAESPHAQVGLKHVEYHVGPGLTVTTTVKSSTLDATAVRKVMKAHMNLTFKLVVDACFSGRWTELSDQSNLRVILAASRSDQMSFGFVANGTWAKQSQTNAVITTVPGSVTINVTNTFQAGGFTNAIMTGLNTWVTQPGSTDLATGLVKAFNGAAAIDASQMLGWTAAGLNDFSVGRPHAPPPGTGFTVTTAMTYRHIAPGSSEVCIKVTTSPPRGGAALHLRVTGPGVVSGGDQNLTLDGLGTAFVRVPINQFGDYAAGADVTAAPGDTATGAGQETVTSAQGDCPAP